MKSNIEKSISAFKEKIYGLVNKYLHNKYEEILNNNVQLKEVLSKLDLSLTSLVQFNMAKTERLASPLEHLKDKDNEWEGFEGAVEKFYYNEAKERDDNPWNPLPVESIIKLAKNLRKTDEKKYNLAKEKEIKSKNETLMLIKSLRNEHETSGTHSNSILSKTGDPDLDSAFHALLATLRNQIAEKHFYLLETDPQAICKRLAILLGEEAYLAFVEQMCADIQTQLLTEEFKIEDKKTLEPLLKKNNFILFGMVKDLPKLALPQSLSDGDAIRFSYGNKGL